MRISNKSNSDKRLVNLDFLRGFFVVLAMYEHFTFYLNMWYVENFKEFAAVKTIYHSHFSMLGKTLSADKIMYLFGIVFVPWVSQIYLALAAFNVAKNTQEDLKSKINTKIKFLFLMLGVFYLENFLVSYDLGQAISIYPIMLWMFILIVINFTYSYFGIRGIFVLTLLSLGRWLLPMEDISDGFEQWVKIVIHPSFDYDARIEYFLTSGCLGFWLGYIHHQRKELGKRKDLFVAFSGLIMMALYIKFTNGPSADVNNAYHYEHECSRTFLGSSFIWGAELFVISLFLYLEKINIIFKIKFFQWVGLNSLLVFLCHKLFFTRVVMPITLFIYAHLGWTLEASFLGITNYVLVTLLMCWLVKKLNIAAIISRDVKVN